MSLCIVAYAFNYAGDVDNVVHVKDCHWPLPTLSPADEVICHLIDAIHGTFRQIVVHYRVQFIFVIQVNFADGMHRGDHYLLV